jgi:hypothetical protein
LVSTGDGSEGVGFIATTPEAALGVPARHLIRLTGETGQGVAVVFVRHTFRHARDAPPRDLEGFVRDQGPLGDERESRRIDENTRLQDFARDHDLKIQTRRIKERRVEVDDAPQG